jgi:hypothetical protein
VAFRLRSAGGGSHSVAMRRPGFRLTSAALCAALILSITASGCALLRRPEPPVDRSQDPRILREVTARIAAEPVLDLARIRVEVDGAMVVLYGSVDGLGAWNCAIRNAQLVEGVRSVVDYLIIERGERDVSCRAPRAT